MLESSNSFCICPFLPFAIVAIIANKFSTRKLSCYGGSIWQILLVVTIMFGPNQSNVINICHGLQTFGAPRIQMPINICKKWKRARNDIDKIQVETKAADNMQKVALNGPNCG
jgi:inner membrane protein involved in colicin E2 resistance